MRFHEWISAREADRDAVTGLTVDARPEGVWSALPDELFEMTALEELLLIAHDGLAISARITELTALRSLTLAGGRYLLPDELGELSSLRELAITGFEMAPLPASARNLRLERLRLEAKNWDESIEVIAAIPVAINVTLLDAHPMFAEDLERMDLSAWSELRELEIDAFEDFSPTVFERKLRNCGFAINHKRQVDWNL